jgi:hypothetical protein
LASHLPWREVLFRACQELIEVTAGLRRHRRFDSIAVLATHNQGCPNSPTIRALGAALSQVVARRIEGDLDKPDVELP